LWVCYLLERIKIYQHSKIYGLTYICNNTYVYSQYMQTLAEPDKQREPIDFKGKYNESFD